MTRLVLDTSAYSHFQRGHGEVIARIDAASWIGVPVVTIGELGSGFRAGNRIDANLSLLERFLGSRVVDVISIDRYVAEVYSEIVNALRRAGTPLPTNDIWIAACAAASGGTVLTFDEHFTRIERAGAIVLTS